MLEDPGKVKTSVSLSKKAWCRAKESIDGNEFVSVSGVIEAALWYYFGREDERTKSKIVENDVNLMQVFEAFIRSDEGRKAIEKIASEKKDPDKKRITKVE